MAGIGAGTAHSAHGLLSGKLLVMRVMLAATRHILMRHDHGGTVMHNGSLRPHATHVITCRTANHRRAATAASEWTHPGPQRAEQSVSMQLSHTPH